MLKINKLTIFISEKRHQRRIVQIIYNKIFLSFEFPLSKVTSVAVSKATSGRV